MSEEILNPNEQIVKQASAKYQIPGGRMAFNGKLILTNERLLFTKVKSFLFFFFRKTVASVNTTLDRIEDVKTRGKIRKSLIVTYKKNGEQKTASFKVSDVDEWVAILEEKIRPELQ